MNKTLFLLCLTFIFGLALILSVPRLAAQAAPPPRLHLRFDAGWRFHRGDAPGAERASFAERGLAARGPAP